MRKMSLYLWCTAFFLITFDQALCLEWRGYTIKPYYFLFLLTGVSLLLPPRKENLQAALLALKNLGKTPFVFISLLIAYEYLGVSWSLLPGKSAAYASWLLFDLIFIAVCGVLAFARAGAEESFRALSTAFKFSVFFLSAVLLIDYIAYFYGYTGGLVGFNQDARLRWGISRPHAFAFEPSYLAMYFVNGIALLVLNFTKEKISFSDIAAYLSAGVSLLLLGSRTGWAFSVLSLLLCLSAFLFQRKIVLRRAALACLAAAALALGFHFAQPKAQSAVVSEMLVSGLSQGTDGSANARYSGILMGVEIAEATSYRGAGAGASYAFIMNRDEHREIRPDEKGAEAVLNIWFQLFAENGISGVLLFLGFSLTTLLPSLKALKRMEIEPRKTALLVSALVFFLFLAQLVGNVARSDIWVWFTVWIFFLHQERFTGTESAE